MKENVLPEEQIYIIMVEEKQKKTLRSVWLKEIFTLVRCIKIFLSFMQKEIIYIILGKGNILNSLRGKYLYQSRCVYVFIPSPVREGSTLFGDHSGSNLLNRAKTSQEG